MTQKPNAKPRPVLVRCAIYTRKSTEEGLHQEFNSLDAQREAGEAYIASQQHEGWGCLPNRYDDGGFTGGNLDRPAMKRLMADIQAGKIDCVVVYKVDRLSRSLLDFARIMEVFDKQKVAFVSVTQHFNTATSMGRLVLNVLLSFAQFEREIIGERIRDKLAAQKRKGKWTGGAPILGYDVDRSGPSPKLVVNAAEAARVRHIFELYLSKGSLMPVVAELARKGWTTKSCARQYRGAERQRGHHRRTSAAAPGGLDPLIDPFPDRNEIRHNVVLANGDNIDRLLDPFPGSDLLWDGSGTGNCWSRNLFQTSFPELPDCEP
jgi:site-specific DNA recombinase